MDSGYSHSCALRANGEVSCWGSNYNNQLGDGFLGTTLSLRQVDLF